MSNNQIGAAVVVFAIICWTMAFVMHKTGFHLSTQTDKCSCTCKCGG